MRNKKNKICCCLQLNEKGKYLMLVMLKNTINHFWKINSKNWLNEQKYSSTKSFRKPKYYWHKSSYYKTSKKFLQIIQNYKAAQKVSQVDGAGKISTNLLYSERTKCRNLFDEDNTTKKQK